MTDSPRIDGASKGANLVLVVEDEVVIREFVCELLTDEGWKAEGVESADDALAFLNQHSNEVGLLLTDILMPGSMNGAGLANYSAQTWPNIPIMIMSGHETPESSGVTIPVSFVRKPWTMGQLLAGVEKALATVPRAVS
ncbi:response regulator [Pseudomonas sp. CFBP 13719]|uniref:response regulator n=1 Tax=Pseudomonas sp. CFBP 13719 TaxID=2775303 RepID=UPI001783F465|nr:response regulator [Pseudomonas sp. CFBP 13719]MBD8682909.1 response regulator [Pseudomonas sp. CFBP 13719]